MRKHTPEKRYVVCIKNKGFPASLVVRRIYECLPEPEAGKRGLLRVIDESGEDYLYPEELFVAIDLPKAVAEAVSLAT